MTRMIRTSALLLAVISLSLSTARAHGGNIGPTEGSMYLNIGIKLGFDFESQEGVYGFETSITRFGEICHGFVVGIDSWRGGVRFQLGYEGAVTGMLGLGLESGPTFAFTPDGSDVGWHLTGFALAAVIPYVQGTLMSDATHVEAGILLKVPKSMP